MLVVGIIVLAISFLAAFYAGVHCGLHLPHDRVCIDPYCAKKAPRKATMPKPFPVIKRPNGFTLAELFVVTAIVFIFLLGVGALFQPLGASRVKAHAETYARTYARTFKGWDNPVVDCMGVDTQPANGYVTCTVVERPGTPPQQIECVANTFFEFNTGCREYRLNTIQMVQPQ